MPVLPIIGAAVGIASTVATISAQSKAAKAQKEGIKNQENYAQAQYELQQKAVEDQKKYAAEEQLYNQKQISLLQQQQTMREDFSMLNTEVQALDAQAQVNQQELAAKGQGIQARGELKSAEAGAKAEEMQANSQQSQQGAAVYQQQANELATFGRILSDSERQMIGQIAAVSAQTGSNSMQTQTGQSLAQKQSMEASDAMSDQKVRAGRTTDEERFQRTQTKEIAALPKEAKLGNIDAQRKLVALQETLSKSNAAGSKKNIELGTKANQAGIKIEGLSQRSLLAMQRSQQDAASAAQMGQLTRSSLLAKEGLASQMAGFQAQRSSVQGPGLFTYLNAGLGAYNSLRGAGVFGTPQGQYVSPVKPYQAPEMTYQQQGYDPAVHGVTTDASGNMVPINPGVR